MTLRTTDMEGGSNGTAVTAALLGAASPQNPTVEAGGSIVFSNATPYQGALCMRTHFPAAGSTGVFAYLAPPASSTTMAFGFAFRLRTDYASATFASIAQYRWTSGPLFDFRIEWNSGVASLRFFVGSGGSAVNVGQVGTGSLDETGATWYRVSGEVNTATGAYSVRLRNGSTDALIGTTLTGTHATLNTSNAVSQGRFGVIGSAPMDLDIDHDWISFNDGSTTEVSMPTTALDAPTVTNVSSTNASSGMSDGTVTITWSAVTGAVRYEVALEPGSVSSGFVADNTNATSPHTFTGLAAGEYTYAVRAMGS